MAGTIVLPDQLKSNADVELLQQGAAERFSILDLSPGFTLTKLLTQTNLVI